MGRRKSKQASGNAALTHYERRHKLTGDHGTLERRLAGHTQYQLGDCGLSLTSLQDATQVLSSPSGHLYEDQAILEYLVTQTQQLKEEQKKQQAISASNEVVQDSTELESKKRKAAFEDSQKVGKKASIEKTDRVSAAKLDLKRTSYWLADAQPILSQESDAGPVSTRPLSPHSQQPLKRKDLWPVQLEFEHSAVKDKPKLLCGLTGKPIRTQSALAYWTCSRPHQTTDAPGRIVLEEDGFQKLIRDGGDKKKKSSGKDNDDDDKAKQTLYCPLTNQKIKHTRVLQRSGSNFSTSGQSTVVSIYRPTMT